MSHLNPLGVEVSDPSWIPTFRVRLAQDEWNANESTVSRASQLQIGRSCRSDARKHKMHEDALCQHAAYPSSVASVASVAVRCSTLRHVAARCRDMWDTMRLRRPRPQGPCQGAPFQNPQLLWPQGWTRLPGGIYESYTCSETQSCYSDHSDFN